MQLAAQLSPKRRPEPPCRGSGDLCRGGCVCAGLVLPGPLTSKRSCCLTPKTLPLCEEGPFPASWPGPQAPVGAPCPSLDSPIVSRSCSAPRLPCTRLGLGSGKPVCVKGCGQLEICGRSVSGLLTIATAVPGEGDHQASHGLGVPCGQRSPRFRCSQYTTSRAPGCLDAPTPCPAGE